jgi:hypothetical protein
MNKKELSPRVKRIRESYAKMREKFWPEVTEDLLWHKSDSKEKAGFSQIPRCITFIGIILDELARNMKISSSYLSLWCHVFDEAMVVINDQEAMAFESGFTKGQRAVYTWKTRMEELVRLGFIKTAPGRSGPYNYVLILNPFKVIKMLREKGTITEEASYNALLDRAAEVGADEDLYEKEE